MLTVWGGEEDLPMYYAVQNRLSIEIEISKILWQHRKKWNYPNLIC